ncbi:fibronectin type III domain-containing protein [Vibrio vulnificus]|uniref:fibronectin type III domain-containing protein n=1 Tax=Vibrio vulnificus TaxID=672 RepID=UPI001022FC03|nr:fibronectin type III domain-containing protein [Vibrio vulnificus]RZQ30232.1 fibronectin type III domain-containing protein [Vibrio vulnificus]RZQ34740.1 fibronectin type III domain-containing protein [Vibrio vulnificus]RZQ84688.1 fibronectin type III domain-containing protein [Vibrio vulnificus]
MRLFAKSLVASTIAGLLTACGGGDGGGSATSPATSTKVTLTGFVTPSQATPLNSHETTTTEVRLLAGEEIVARSTAKRHAGEHQPRYLLEVDPAKLSDALPLAIEAVSVVYPLESSNEVRTSSTATTNTEKTAIREVLLYRNAIGAKKPLLAADKNGDSFITHDEWLPLTFSQTNSLFVALDPSGERSALELMDEHGREKIMAIAALLHTISDPFDSEKQVALSSLEMEKASLIDALLKHETIAAPLTEGARWIDMVSSVYEQMAQSQAIVLADGWQKRIEDKWIEMHAVEQSNVLREVLDNSYPTRTLVLKGETVSGMKNPQISLQIGSYPNDPLASSHYDNPLKPKRPLLLPITPAGAVKSSTVIEGANRQFELRLTLRDTANGFDACQPTGNEVYVYYDKNEDLTKPSAHPTDNMQDLLTVIAYDPASGVEMRSYLGAFCELASADIDKNQDGIVTAEEFPRLKISFENNAHALLAERSGLMHHGGGQYAKPVKQTAIDTLFAKHTPEMLQLMSSIVAMQMASAHNNKLPAIDNASDFFRTAAQLLDLDYNAQYRMYSKSNLLPEPFQVIQLLKNISDVAHHMEDTDTTINNLLKWSAQAFSNLSQFPADTKMASELNTAMDSNTSWLPTEPINGLESICSTEFAQDQIRGIAVRGRGDDWLTLEWQPQGNSGYTLHWDTKPFTNLSEAANQTTAEKNITTLTGLTKFTRYYFQIAHKGTPSAQFNVRIGDAGLTNSHRFDSDFGCDPMSGYARNSNADGYQSLSFLKIDAQGERLARQDLPYIATPHSCTVESKTGRTWAVPNSEMEEGDRIRHWYGIDNRYLHGDNLAVRDDQYNGFCVALNGDVYSQDKARQCTVNQLVQRANESKLCGISEWRLPTYEETLNILTLKGKPQLNFDDDYFPNLDGNMLWMKQENPDVQTHANLLFATSWNVRTRLGERKSPHQVILVSNGLKVDQE